MNILTVAELLSSTTVARQTPPVKSLHPIGSSLLPDLIARATQGFNEAELAHATVLGYHGYLEYQLNYLNIDDSQNENYILGQYPFLKWTTAQTLSNGTTGIQTALTQATLLRSVLGKRQLFERMVEFWGDHFNISIGENGLPENLRTEFDWAVLRANALGTFPALLRAVAHSAAMMVFLNNDQNVAGNPNENYARELMELHTLGVDNGYTQQDVQEVARCLTGWGTSSWSGGFAFHFDPSVHDNGTKTVLGTTIPAGGGKNDGETVLNLLASHTNTAHFIGKKMLIWLLGYTPAPDLIEGIAQVYLSTGGDIKAMIRYALSPSNTIGKTPKFKRPFHLFVSTLRALNAQMTLNADIFWRLGDAGHVPFTWTMPNGFPDTLDFWSGLMLPRWNFVTSLMDTGLTGITYDLSQITQGATTAQAITSRINTSIFAGRMSAADKAAITNYLLPNPPNARRISEAIGLAFAAPGFQWY